MSILISESINKIIEEIKDYHQNEDYINSKKLGTRIGAGMGALVGGTLGYMGASHEFGTPEYNLGPYALATLGGAAAGGAIHGAIGRIKGHYAGKEMAKDPKHLSKSAMKGFMKSNLEVDVPVNAALGGIIGGLAHHTGESPEEIAKLAGIGAASAGIRQLIGGTVGSIPGGALHGAIVKSMRKSK